MSIYKRSFFLFLLSVIFLCISCDGNETSDSFPAKPVSAAYTIAALPDTQCYSEDSALTPVFTNQVKWIANNAVKENIIFATHLGDVVDNGADEAQWSNAMKAFDGLFKMNNDFPYSISQGNHDGIELYTKYLGASRYTGKKWYAGSSANELNHAQLLAVEHRRIIHINFQKDPDAAAFAWAQSILDDSRYTKLPVIVSTHDYVVYGGRGPTGKSIWENFIKKNKQIFMILNGHTHTEYAFISHNESNKPVFQILSDYQDRDNGGNGLMRLITFDENAGTISVKTFSPGFEIIDGDESIHIDPYFENDRDSEFVYNINLVERFNYDSSYDFGSEPEKPPLPESRKITEPATHIFQQRKSDYSSTIDTQLNENNPSLNYAGEATLTTDMDDSGSRVNGLLGFMNIIGNGTGQIKPGSKIESAKILFEVTSSTAGTVSFHRMLREWDENSVWYDFTPLDPVTGDPSWYDLSYTCPKIGPVTAHVMVGGGIQADDVEARSSADVSFTCKKGFSTPFIVDVTTSVQAWADGEANYGWAMLNNSTDGWDFVTCHGGNPPALVVTVEGEALINP